MQVWLADADRIRLLYLAKKTGRTQSDIARQGILSVLEELEKEDRQKTAIHELFKSFSKASENVVFMARQEAEVERTPLVGSEHLLLALAVDGRTGKLLSKFGAAYHLLRAKLHPGMASFYTEVVMPPYSPRFVRVIDRSRLIAKRHSDKRVQPEHLLLSVLEQGNGAAYDLLELIGVERNELRDAVIKEFPRLRKDRIWKR
jgi:ATP-dependent Clp protease ATP-binding subunit ClpA